MRSFGFLRHGHRRVGEEECRSDSHARIMTRFIPDIVLDLASFGLDIIGSEIRHCNNARMGDAAMVTLGEVH